MFSQKHMFSQSVFILRVYSPKNSVSLVNVPQTWPASKSCRCYYCQHAALFTPSFFLKHFLGQFWTFGSMFFLFDIFVGNFQNISGLFCFTALSLPAHQVLHFWRLAARDKQLPNCKTSKEGRICRWNIWPKCEENMKTFRTTKLLISIVYCMLYICYS